MLPARSRRPACRLTRRSRRGSPRSGTSAGPPAGRPGRGLPRPVGAGRDRVQGTHVNELRPLVDTVRAVCELPRATWTDRTITPGETPVKAVHLTELRTALTEAYGACSLTPPTYTDPTIVRGRTPVKAVHWTELRDAGSERWMRQSPERQGTPRTGAPCRESGEGRRRKHGVRGPGSGPAGTGLGSAGQPVRVVGEFGDGTAICPARQVIVRVGVPNSRNGLQAARHGSALGSCAGGNSAPSGWFSSSRRA